MSGVIDKNVVQMVFDNVLFQKNAQDTLSTLDKLKEALNFEGAIKGLEGLGNNVKNVGMDGLYNGVYKVQEGFNALDVVATRVLQNITDKVQGVVSQLANDALLQPLKDGFSEYELQMDSVQTIMSSTGESVGKVNGYLDELNEYADRTIYSFSDMTANIGKFTNAGVSLDKAVAAIQGVSNVAAISGANTNEASRAMYNFAQALSAGSVKLIDWKSIENANMATVGFKQSLIDTAVAMGTLTKEGDKYVSTTTDANGKVSEAFNATSMFNDSLSSQWMTTDVLVQTLEQYSTDVRTLTDDEKKLYEEQLKGLGYSDEQIAAIEELGIKAANSAKDVKTFSQLIDTLKESLGSGWTKTWQMIFGDLNEAKVLWTAVNDVLSGFIGKVSDSRNAILETWHKSGYTYNEYGELVKAVYDENGKLDAELSTELVENGKMVREEMGGRDFLLGGLANTYHIFAEVMKEFGTAWQKYFVGIDNPAIDDISITGEKLVDLSRGFYDATEAMKAAWTQRDDQQKAVGLLGQLAESFKFFMTSLRTGFEGIRGIFDGVKNVSDAFFHSSFFSFNSLNSAITAFSAFTGVLKDFGDGVRKHLGTDNKTNLESLMRFFGGLQGLLESTIWVKIDFITNGLRALGSVADHVLEPFGGLAGLLGNVGDKMSMFAHAIDSIVNTEDVSKFETFFTGLADGFNNFIDMLRSTVDFSGFSKFFNNLIEAISSDKIDLFKVFENVFGGLIDVFKAFLAIATPVAAAFADIFGDAIGEALQFIRELSDRFKSFTESLIANEEVIAGIQNLFEGIFSVLKAIGEVVGNVLLAAWDSLTQIFSRFLPDGKSLGETLTDMGEKLKGVAEVISSLVKGEDGVPKLSDLIGTITDKFVNFFGALKDISLLEKLKDLLEKIGDGIKHALGGTEDMTLFDTIIEKIKGFLDGIKRILSDDNGQLDIAKVFEAGGIGVLIKKLVEMLTNLKQNAGNLTGVLGFINDIKEALTGLSEAFQEKFKAESIKAIATSILEIAGALFIVAMIDPVALATAIGAIKAMFVMIAELLAATKGFNKTDIAALGATAAVLQTLGNAILMMAGAVFVLGSMPLENTIQGVIALGIMLEGLVEVVKQLASIEKDIPKVAGALIALALAIDLLTIPVAVLGNMDLGNLAKGLGAVAAMMAGLVGSAIALSKWGKSFSAGDGLGLILMAEAINILGTAVNKVADLSWEQIAKGLAVMAAGLIAMVGAAAVVSKANLGDDLLAVGGSLIMLGVAMMMLTTAAQGIANVSWEDLGKMAAVLAGALIALGIASYAINGKNLLMIGAAIALVATAFLELNAALGLAQLVGPLMTSISMAIEGFSYSLESFAHSAARDAFLQFLKDAILFLPQLAVGLAQALIEMVVALGEGAAKIVGAVVKIGQEILQGVVTLLPELFNVVRTFIEQVIQLIIDETPRIFEGLAVFFEQLWVFLGEQVPNFFTFLTTVFTELFTFLQTEAPMLIETIRMIINTVLQAIIAEAPVIGETLLTLLHTLLEIINTAIPEITHTLLNLITSILQQLAEFVPQMAQAAMEIILGFLTAIAENIGAITEAAISIAIGFMEGITQKMPELVDTAFKMIIGFINGLASAIEENHNELFDAIGHLIKAIVEAILDGIGKVAEAAGKWITGEDGNGGILGAIGGFVQNIFDAGANLVKGFIDGLTSMPGKLWDAACGLANDAWNAITGTLDEHSPSRLTYGGGKNFTLGFINGMSDYSEDAAIASGNMAYGVLGAFNSAIASGADSYSPSIVPIFDDSNVVNGINGIGDTNVTADLTAKLTAQVDNSIAVANNKLEELSWKFDQVMMKQDELFERVDYWLESIEGDTIEIAGCALKGSNIYMDTGSLVGAIAPEMDQALGRTAILTGRGV